VLLRRVTAEFVGTALLLAIVVGSGVMGERLSPGNVALALLANALATGAGLVVLILAFGPISGAHFNPIVTLAEAILGRREKFELLAYLPAQFFGALFGVLVTHYLFDLPLLEISTKVRSGLPLVGSEIVATFGLLVTILFIGKTRSDSIPLAVGAYITSAYWFTPSTSFANPAVTFARAWTETFAGIQLGNVPGFVFGQVVGMALALGLFRILHPQENSA
jgi:glycerol uptake facilitator-like aquaporin